MRGYFSLGPILALLCLTPSVAAASSIADIAAELTQAVTERATCKADERVKVGIWPFNAVELPIGRDSAQRVYSQVLSTLTEDKADCVDLIEVGGLAQNAQLMSAVSAGSASNATHAEIFRSLEDVDYILAGTILSDGPNAYAVFKLSDRATGALVYQSAQAEIPLSSVGTTCAAPLPLPVAIEGLAADVRARADSLQHLVVEGGYYADTSGRTEFSQFLEPLIVGDITKAYENAVTDRNVSVRYVHSQDDNELLKLRGIAITPEKLDAVEHAPVPAERSDLAPGSVYRMSFRYWPCEDSVRLVVNLVSDDDRLVSWTGGIRKTDIPRDVSLEPVTPTEVRDWGPDGAFSFRMTSRRGPAPTFRPGESFETLFLLSRDAWLYCFYTDASGDTTQLLPNPTQIDRAAPNFYPGGQVQIFPDKQRLPEPDPFSLTILDNTTGIEVFRCFATSRNVTPDLPAPLRGQSFDPLPQSYAARLREVFEAIQGSSMSTASMTVTVLE